MENLFQKEFIQNAINEYQSVVYKEDQRKIVESLSKVICSFIDMNEVAMRGFMMKAIGNWQQKHKLRISDLIEMTKNDRTRHVSEMLNDLKVVLAEGLKNNLEQSKIDSGIEKALQYYIDNYSGR